MPLDNKISNIMGTKLPQWVLNQLETRANKNTQDSRDNDNILYLTNKSAWVRLVSSVDIANTDLLYFKNQVGANLETNNIPGFLMQPDSLAKQYVLFGGTSKYLNKNSYGLRSGIDNDGAYGMLGKSEVQQFGYKPMPGITNVTIDTQGRLGSVRAATINFKCWDKSQLDIIDALYFKLGFTMFLEWGHTYFYYSGQNTEKRDPNKIVSTELYSIDPFEQGLNKEDIQIQIAKNSRNTEGNYDAMLGIVTNFNFSYTQDGGYDCSIRLMGLGVLGDSIKINNSGTLPALLIEEIVQLNNTLLEIQKDLNARAAAQNSTNNLNKNIETESISKISSKDFVDKYIKYDPNRTGQNKYSGGQLSWPANVAVNNNTFDAVFNTQAYGPVYFIRNQKGFIPISDSLLDAVKINLDADKILQKLNSVTLNKIKGFSDPRIWTIPNNYLESLKTAATAPITTVVNLLNTLINFNKVTIDSGESELDKINDTAVIDFNYSSQNTLKYKIRIERKLWATSDREDIVDSYSSISRGLSYSNSAYYYIDTPTFTTQFKNVLNSPNNTFTIKSVDAIPNTTTTNIEIIVPFTRSVKVSSVGKTLPDVINPDGTVTKGTKLPDTISDADVTFKLLVKLSIDDSSLIKNFTTQNVIQPLDYKDTQKNLSDQDKVETVIEQTPEEKKAALETQVKQSLNYQSTLEIMLRTIQVHALNKAINNTKKDLEIGRTTYVLNIADPNDKIGNKTFLEQIFSTGIFSGFIKELVKDPSNKLSDLLYTTDKKMNAQDRFKIQSKYGFATSLLGNKENIEDIPKVNFEELLKAYVVPYQINQEIIKGTYTNHPVYIPLGLLLMILNHACTIYDTSKDNSFQTPLVYVDFNPETNFCLTNAKQLSTDPWRCLIPFEGGFDDYKTLFDKDILTKDATAIQPTSGSTESIPLFNPETNDFLSGTLPKLKFDTKPTLVPFIDPLSGNFELLGFSVETGNIYRGKMMNILLNIDYLVELAQQNSYKDGTNSVYLKTFIEQILNGVNKSLGNFNIFRLSYNDSANTFQIVDDQVVPTLSNEDQVTPKPEGIKIQNTTELPLAGKFSIAKNLEIKSEVSSKLSNMLAISANANYQNKATLSTNGDSFGFINTSYVDRYISNRGEITSGSGDFKSGNDTLKISAAQFNMAISDFYSKINPSQTSVSHATNYYIEKMTLVKNNEYATRASAMIPVSVNFTTDGISGLSMGQAFTVPDILLPYTYTTRKIPGAPQDHLKNVGFAVVGLTHTIENNQWNTAVRANMIYLKDKTEFTGSVVKVDTRTGQFGINEFNEVSVTIGSVSLSDLNINQDWENIAFDYISSKEGFLEKPKPDQGTLRAGYGTSIIVDSDGNIKSVGTNTVFTKESAKRTLVYQIKSTFSKKVIDSIGQSNWNNLNSRQKAALVSFAYNVGSINNKIATAIKSNTGPQAVANAIASGPYTGKISGYLPELETRRKEEATLYLS